MANEATFNYRNNPIIEKIDKKSLGVIGIDERDRQFFQDYKDQLIKKWKTDAHLFGKNIWHISEPFLEAMNLAKEKLLTTEMIEQIGTQSGTLIIGNITYCFNIINNSQFLYVNVIGFLDDVLFTFGEHLSYAEIPENDGKEGNYTFWLSKSQEATDKGENEMLIAFDQIMIQIYLFMNFVKYAEIQTKVLPPNSKVKKDAFHKYVNETNSKIIILNSTWFTTLVQSKGFTVRGHFRLQACGIGFSQKRLTWIAEFEKEGYTAPARKLSQEL